jgi:hypothetical protein
MKSAGEKSSCEERAQGQGVKRRTHDKDMSDTNWIIGWILSNDRSE